MYQYMIINEAGSIIYADEDKHHVKALADEMQRRTGKTYFVDCMLSSVLGLCDHVPLERTQSTPEQRLDPY